MSNTHTRLILVHPSLLSTARKAAQKASLPASSLYTFADTPEAEVDGIKDWRSILASSRDASSYRWPAFDGAAAKSQIASINYSSGTTGLPKGVMVSHANLIANVSQSLAVKYSSSEAARQKAGHAEDSDQEEERWIGLLPLYHAFGQMNFIGIAPKLLAPVYILPTFDFETFLATIERRRITTIHVAPPILVLLNKHPAVQKYDLSSVRHITYGAAPLSQSLQNAVSHSIGTSIGQGWGMTELTCTGTVVPSQRNDETGSVGPPLPNCEIKLVNENGDDVTASGSLKECAGKRGEIHIRGPNASPGYWRNEKATRETMLPDGWLRTGDVGVLDERGWITIVDRLKELIKVSGLQVAPAELEAVLLGHPDIADAGVVGTTDGEFGGRELVRAYVMLKEEKRGRVREEEVVRWMEGKVSKHKWLTGGVKFVDVVPKSAAGKIIRTRLREMAKRDREERLAPRARL